jgi:hypothetical protein
VVELEAYIDIKCKQKGLNVDKIHSIDCLRAYTSTMIGIDAICVQGCRANRETNASVSTSYLIRFRGVDTKININNQLSNQVK